MCIQATLGWVAFIVFGSLYNMIPGLYGKKQMYSVDLINVHFWVSTIGVGRIYLINVDRWSYARFDVASDQ